MAAAKKPKKTKKPLAKAAKRTVKKAAKPVRKTGKRNAPTGAATLASDVPSPEVLALTCPARVRAAVRSWCGHPVPDGTITLGQAYAPRGACNRGSLLRLRDILHRPYFITVAPRYLSCGMTINDLTTLVC